MTRAEVDYIAWELCKIIEASEDKQCALDVGMLIASTSLDAVDNIVNKYPKIAEALAMYKGV